MNRRQFTRTVAGAGAVTVLTPAALLQMACSPKNLSAWVVTITGAFGEIKPLLKELGLAQSLLDKLSGLIDKGVTIARDFDAAYKVGKFTDARALFLNLGDVIAQVAGELNLANNRIVHLAIISISIARIAIAAMLDSQARTQPEVMAAANKAKSAGGEDARAIKEIERLSAIDVSKILAAIQ